MNRYPILFATVAIIAAFSSTSNAYAYSMNDGSGGPLSTFSATSSVSNLMSPFENFFTSAQVAAPAITNQTEGSNSDQEQSFASHFDPTPYLTKINDLVYQTTHVDISGIPNIISNIVGIIAGLAIQGINWVINFLK